MISTEKQEENYYPALIEALLFVAEEPITILNLAKVLEIKPQFLVLSEHRGHSRLM